MISNFFVGVGRSVKRGEVVKDGKGEKMRLAGGDDNKFRSFISFNAILRNRHDKTRLKKDQP